ncbi:hypothetical protein AOR04_13965 [Pseudoalteromonas sp. 1_2015MBL_MicDiv]|nr:hypothetical protein AOR04_13965 [Pseudoalteromonas sp. 1_2015MBL_MicDiv]
MERDLVIFKIHKPSKTYDIIDLTTVSMAKQIPKEKESSFNEAVKIAMDDFPRGKAKILDVVENGFNCKVEKEAEQQDYDINLFSSYLVLNKKAYTAIGNHLQGCGEFVPLNCEKELFLFNPLIFEEEDKDLTEKAYLDGFEDGLKSLAFKSDLNLIFKSSMQGGKSIYCNAAFKTLVKENNLTGITFNSDLLSIFA